MATLQLTKKRQKYLLYAMIAAFGVAIAALMGASYQGVRHAESLQEMSRQEVDIDQRAQLFHALLMAATEAETGQRGYLLTGKDRYLATYAQARTKIPQLLAKLEQHPVTDRALLEHRRVIRERLTEKLTELQETIRLYESGQKEAALVLVQTDQGLQFMEGLREETDTLQAILRRGHDAATANVIRSAEKNKNIIVWAVIALTVTVLLIFIQLILWRRSRRRYETALRISREQLKALVDEQSELIVVAAVDGALTYANPAFARHMQLDVAQIIGRSLFDFIDPHDHEQLRSSLQAAPGSAATSAEYCTQAADGMGYWVVWTNQVRTNARGEPELYSIGRDITERKAAELRLRASESLLTRMGHIGRIAGWDYDIAADDLQWSEELFSIFEVPAGYSPSRDNATEHMVDADDRRWLKQALGAASNDGPEWARECQMRTSAGNLLWARVVIEVERDADGRPRRYVGTLQDITQRKHLEHLLERQAATLNAVVETLPVMIAVWDTEMRFTLVNHSFEHWRGRTRQQVLGRRYEDAVGAHEFQISLPWMKRALAGETVTFEKDYPESPTFRHLSITYAPLYLDNGAVGGFIGIAQNITEHRNENSRLLNLSQSDPLTGLFNRAGFQAFLERKTEDAGLGAYAVLYIDLDRFKPVNDTHGHAVGDELLRQFGHRIEQLVRPSDAVARLGGDEFAVVLGSVRSQAVADRIADKIVAAAQEPFTVEHLQLAIGASVGVALGLPNESWQQVVKRADALVYEAKSRGRGQRA